MKLLLLTALKEFEKDIKQIFKKLGVKSFSYRDVNGFKDSSEEVMEDNWFASNMQENESVLFYAFVEKGNVETVFGKVADFNEKQNMESHIHLAMLNIEKSN